MGYYDIPDPSWKLNPDIVADESFREIYGESEDDYFVNASDLEDEEEGCAEEDC